ncbi:TPA: hypothetical protein ACH3X2_009903 [Trebouxia sp. C0005]
MLKLDQDSDQKVSVNWRRVASTHSFQVCCTLLDTTCKDYWGTFTRAVAQELLSKQSEHHKSYGFSTVIWGLVLILAASLLLFGTVFCLVVSLSILQTYPVQNPQRTRPIKAT